MSLDPQKFFIGLIDFFTILLPGALLCFALMDDWVPLLIGVEFDPMDASDWLQFLFASYLFGHLIFHIGSWLDILYEWARGRTLNAQIARLARYGTLFPGFIRALSWLVFRNERNVAVERAERIKEQMLGPLQAKDSINTFQWSKAFLTVEGPARLAVVQRFEADSKFFCSFVIVLFLILFAELFPHEHDWPAAGVPVVLFLMLLALWRYMEQRHKATNQAYWSVITLVAKGEKVRLEDPPLRPGSPTRAGGVVFRKSLRGLEYLLVEATEYPDQEVRDDPESETKARKDKLVLPKGHVEGRENPRATAVREVHEETGTWGKILRDIGDVSFADDNGTPVTFRCYLMQSVGWGWPSDRGRKHYWLTLEEALTRVHEQTRAKLQSADQQRIDYETSASPTPKA